MKRLFSVLIILCLVFSGAFAEEESQKSLWDWLGQAWEDTSGWVSQAWSDASGWVEGAWGDASKWVEQAWNDSSVWVTDIWGDVSTWASEQYDSASNSISTWWTETFNSVTETTTNVWNWIIEEADMLKSNFNDELDSVKKAVAAEGSNKEAIVKDAFDSLLADLKLNSDNSRKVWDTVNAYAAQKGIQPITAEKLALPYLLQLKVDSIAASNEIPAIAIAQYLVAIIEKLDIKSSESADMLVVQLNDALGSV